MTTFITLVPTPIVAAIAAISSARTRARYRPRHWQSQAPMSRAVGARCVYRYRPHRRRAPARWSWAPISSECRHRATRASLSAVCARGRHHLGREPSALRSTGRSCSSQLVLAGDDLGSADLLVAPVAGVGEGVEDRVRDLPLTRSQRWRCSWQRPSTSAVPCPSRLLRASGGAGVDGRRARPGLGRAVPDPRLRQDPQHGQGVSGLDDAPGRAGVRELVVNAYQQVRAGLTPAGQGQQPLTARASADYTRRLVGGPFLPG